MHTYALAILSRVPGQHPDVADLLERDSLMCVLRKSIRIQCNHTAHSILHT